MVDPTSISPTNDEDRSELPGHTNNNASASSSSVDAQSGIALEHADEGDERFMTEQSRKALPNITGKKKSEVQKKSKFQEKSNVQEKSRLPSYSDKVSASDHLPTLHAWLESRLPPAEERDMFDGDRRHEILMYRALNETNAALITATGWTPFQVSVRLNRACKYVAEQLGATSVEIITNLNDDRHRNGVITKGEYQINSSNTKEKLRRTAELEKWNMILPPVDPELPPLPPGYYRCAFGEEINCGHPGCVKRANS